MASISTSSARERLSVELEAELDDLADWGAVGKLVGESHQNYFAVPVFHGYHRTPTADELKHLGAALASYGSMGMFHFVGVTPEAPQARLPVEKDDRRRMPNIESVYAGYKLGDGDATLVVFSGPQQSLFEMKNAGRAFQRTESQSGHLLRHHQHARPQRSRATSATRRRWKTRASTILQGVCFYILQNLSPMREKNRWTNMVSQLGEDREHHRRAPLQHHPAAHRGLRGDRMHREIEVNIAVNRAYRPGRRGRGLVVRGGLLAALRPRPLVGADHQARPPASKARASSTRSASSPPPRAASPPAGRSTTSSGRKSRPRRLSSA